jgi:PAS domain S-box-containing protein
MPNPPEILIVDADEGIRQTLYLTLGQEGYQTIIAESGKQALKLAQDQFYNIALIDIRLPDIIGTNLMTQLKERHPDMEILLITGYATLENAMEAVSDGAYHFFIKPLNMDEVQIKVKEVLDRQQLILENKRLYESTARELAERKRAEAALRQSEAKYRMLFESAGEAIILACLVDKGLKIVDCNADTLKLFGGTRETLIEKTILDLSPAVQPDGQASGDLIKKKAQSALTGTPLFFEWQHCRLDGTLFDSEVILNRVELDNEPYVQGIVRDITQRKQAEEEIRRRNRELTLLNRIIAASATRIDPESILEITCREVAEAFDIPQALAFLPNDQETAKVVVAEYFADKSLSLMGLSIPAENNPIAETLFVQKGPLIINDVQNDERLASSRDLLKQMNMASMLIVPLSIDAEIVGTLNFGTTEPRKFSDEEINLIWTVAGQVSGALARTRLDKERRQLSTVIEQSAESVIITDTSGKIIYVNPAFERITGYSRDEAVGKNPNILNSGQQNSGFYKSLWETITAGQVWHGRLVNKKKDGTLYTEETIIGPVRDNNDNIVNYVSQQRDVTRELQLEEQYRRSQRMEAVGQLTGGIAHDFNNLLTAINGFAELLQLRLPAEDPLQPLVENILNSGLRAADLVSQLLAFSRKTIIEPKILNMNTIVVNMGSILRRVIGEDIELKMILTPDVWSIKVDPTQFEQVIINLAVNARDAMPDGGRLTIETSNVVLDKDYVASHLGAQPGEHVLLAISDTGLGMSEEIQAHIFEPFFTTKEVGKGTGLGLATVFGIIKQIDGNIWVYSEEGQGTTFKIYLPRVSDTAQSMAGSSDDIYLPTGNETILLVEDDAGVRDLAKQILQVQGYTLLVATNGEEALQLAATHNGPIHLLLTDVIMPGISGKTLARQLLQDRAETRVLYMSGYTENVVAHHGILEEDVVFIQKPFNAVTLAQQIRTVLDD